MRRLVPWLVLVLAGCQATGGPTGMRYDRDLYGRVYPEKCRQDLTPLRLQMEHEGRLSVRYVPRWQMATLPDGEQNDAAVSFGKYVHIIKIADDVPEPYLSDALQHEMVHIHCRPWVHD